MLVTTMRRLPFGASSFANHGENLIEAQQVEDLTNMLGSNYRLTELQAAIGVAQLDRLEGYLETRRRLAEHFGRQLASIPGLVPAAVIDGAEHAYYLYPVKYKRRVGRYVANAIRNGGQRRTASTDDLGANRMVEAYVRPLYLARFYQKKIALGARGFPWTVHPSVDYDYRGACAPWPNACMIKS